MIILAIAVLMARTTSAASVPTPLAEHTVSATPVAGAPALQDLTNCARVANINSAATVANVQLPTTTGEFPNADVFTTSEAITESDTNTKEDALSCINLGVRLLRQQGRLHGADALQHLHFTPLPTKEGGLRFLCEADLVKFRVAGEAKSIGEVMRDEKGDPTVLALNDLKILRYPNGNAYVFKGGRLTDSLRLPVTRFQRGVATATPNIQALMTAAQREEEHERNVEMLEQQIRQSNGLLDDATRPSDGFINVNGPNMQWIDYPNGTILEPQP